jgi:hypothetical protein
MGLKTGCALEHRQLKTFDRLANFLVFATAISVLALRLRDAARAVEPRPAADVLSPIQLKLLHQSIPRLRQDCSAKDALRAVAALGGLLRHVEKGAARMENHLRRDADPP